MNEWCCELKLTTTLVLLDEDAELRESLRAPDELVWEAEGDWKIGI